MELKSVEEWKYAIIFLPNIISFSIYYLTRSAYDKTKTNDVWFQPPRYLFFIVWTVLYFYMGYFLYLTLKEKKEVFVTLRYSILALLLSSYVWMLFFGYDKKKEAVWMFIPLILFAISSEVQIYSIYKKPTFLFTAWLIFAFSLSSLDKNH